MTSELLCFCLASTQLALSTSGIILPIWCNCKGTCIVGDEESRSLFCPPHRTEVVRDQMPNEARSSVSLWGFSGLSRPPAAPGGSLRTFAWIPGPKCAKTLLRAGEMATGDTSRIQGSRQPGQLLSVTHCAPRTQSTPQLMHKAEQCQLSYGDTSGLSAMKPGPDENNSHGVAVALLKAYWKKV